MNFGHMKFIIKEKIYLEMVMEIVYGLCLFTV